MACEPNRFLSPARRNRVPQPGRLVARRQPPGQNCDLHAGSNGGRVNLEKVFLTAGESKAEAGERRTIPLNSALQETMLDYAKWYTGRFGTIQPDWYVFAFGKPWPKDPTRPVVTLKTSWRNVKAKTGVSGRWHDNRHTLITDLAESGAGDETIRDIAGHVSKQMLRPTPISVWKPSGRRSNPSWRGR